MASIYSNLLRNDFLLDVARGIVTGYRSVHKFGSNDDVGAAWETVHAPGGTYVWPTTAETIRVKAGGNAADTAAGAGARTVTVQYLDNTWTEQEETLTLAGASASAATTGTAFRVLRAFVETTGTYGVANTGDIIIENTTALQELAFIEADHGQTEMSQYTIPLGFTGYLIQHHVTVGDSDTASLHMYQRTDADTVVAPFGPRRVISVINDYTGAEVLQFANLPVFPEKTDLWWEAIKITGAGTAQVAASYDLILVDNTL